MIIQVVCLLYLSLYWGELRNKDGRYIYLGNKVYFVLLVCYGKLYKIEFLLIEYLNVWVSIYQLIFSNYFMCSEFDYILE